DIGTETCLANEQNIEDDQLRLIFTCCHPALAENVQIALTLREVCGLTTEQIAQAFLIPAPTLAQRIVRAKNKIRDANIPYQIPEKQQLQERLDVVLRVIYLVYNEGYSASSGEQMLKGHLTMEAIRLAKSLKQLLPECKVNGLLALMLLNNSRQTARVKENGDLISLEEQDRTLWDQDLIEQGCQLVTDALQAGELTTYSLQAAISAVHA